MPPTNLTCASYLKYLSYASYLPNLCLLPTVQYLTCPDCREMDGLGSPEGFMDPSMMDLRYQSPTGSYSPKVSYQPFQHSARPGKTPLNLIPACPTARPSLFIYIFPKIILYSTYSVNSLSASFRCLFQVLV